MPQFMLIAGGADLDKRGGNPEFRATMLEHYMGWVQGLQKQGRFVSSQKLSDQTGRRLSIRGGDVMDGPFIESKDAIGGVFIIEASSLDEATEVARSCPVLSLQRGYVEVRLVETNRSGAT
jgi:hypothetical protein